MRLLLTTITLLLPLATSIDIILFEENNCDDPAPDDFPVCVDYAYNQCCGGISDQVDQSYGAAAASLGSTASAGEPTLRAYSQGGQPLSACGIIADNFALTDDPENPGTFPCAAGTFIGQFSGFNVVPVNAPPARKRDVTLDGLTGRGALVDGVVYAIHDGTEEADIYQEMKANGSLIQARAFITERAHRSWTPDMWLS